MTQEQALKIALDAGIVFPEANKVITAKLLASDEALQTEPNSGVPALFTAYIDQQAIDILTAPTNAREIFAEVRKGDWTTSSAVFKTVELTGASTPYTDFGNGATADVNVTFPERQNYVAQTFIRYGEKEMAVYGRALINLAAENQRAAANTINQDQNKFYLLGVEGKEIYGLLNEPNIPAAITPATGEKGTAWADKTTQEIYSDVMLLTAELFENSKGHIDEKADLVLVVPPALNVALGKATDFNVSVMDMLKKYLTNLSVVTLPELAGEANNVMLIARSVNGAPTAQLAFSDKMRAFPLIPGPSSYSQKFAFGTYGCVVYKPFAIAVMTGC